MSYLVLFCVILIHLTKFLIGHVTFYAGKESKY